MYLNFLLKENHVKLISNIWQTEREKCLKLCREINTLAKSQLETHNHSTLN